MTAERERLVSILRDLRLPRDQWFINGSGALCLHGVPRTRPMGDLDVFCTTRLWFDLFERGQHTPALRWELRTPDPHDERRRCDPPNLTTTLHGLRVDVFHTWRRRATDEHIDPGLYLKNAELVDGWPCAPLMFIHDWKLAQGRNKDLLDVIAIRQHLGMGEP